MGMTSERCLLLLGLLRGTDMHGYMLNAHVDGTVPISLKKPTAYNLLERMEKDGWVEHRDEPTGDRPRRVFAVTAKGEGVFQEMLREQLGIFTPAEVPGLVSMSFLDVLPESEAAKLLRQRRESLALHRQALTQHSESGVSADEHHTGSSQLSMVFIRRLLDLEAEFLDEVIQELESK